MGMEIPFPICIVNLFGETWHIHVHIEAGNSIIQPFFREMTLSIHVKAGRPAKLRLRKYLNIKLNVSLSEKCNKVSLQIKIEDIVFTVNSLLIELGYNEMTAYIEVSLFP